ncbi:MAG TPA: tetratricopeptide repeat protein, partial [Bacteroidales bacterium]|nr:tetratricopeptide repeat protein [Bacteroidales bacterium]
MKKTFLFTAIIILLMAGNLYGQNGKKFYKAGQEFYEGLKYEDAIAQFTSAIGQEPSNPDYYISRGKAYEMLNKLSDAKADFEKSLVFDQKNSEAMIRLGAVTSKMKNFREALSILNKATEMARRNHEVYAEKVIAMIGLRKYDQALKSSDTALLIKPNAMDYYYRGVIYTALNNEVLAKKEFDKSIDKDEDLPAPRLALAELLINTDPQAAMAQCMAVISKNDRNTDAYSMRARIYKKNLDFPNAINDVSKNIMIDPENPDFFMQRGILYQEFNQHTNAINDFSKYISMRPDSANAYFRRAKSFEDIMNYDKAIEDYNKIASLSEFDMRARKMLKDAQTRLYELNREKVSPEFNILNPVASKDTVEIKGDVTTLLVSGKIKEKSKLKKFTINNENVITVEKNGEYDFLANVNLAGADRL